MKWMFLAAGLASTVPQPSVDYMQMLKNLAPQKAQSVACCKICSKGKACGNSCISRDKSCHIQGGCAC